MYFHGGEGAGHSFASSRDVDLHREEGRTYWEEEFESPPAGWVSATAAMSHSQIFLRSKEGGAPLSVSSNVSQSSPWGPAARDLGGSKNVGSRLGNSALESCSDLMCHGQGILPETDCRAVLIFRHEASTEAWR